MKRGDTNSQTCPNAVAQIGAHLIGVEGADGKFAFIRPPLPVTEVLLDHITPAKARRLRFASTCLESACAQWLDDTERCRVADVLLGDHIGLPERQDHLPVCGIRSTCRWFNQHGGEVCLRCPGVSREQLK